MSDLRLVFAALLLGAASAQAQTREEIVFWESVRNSSDAVELRAYLQTYPNGSFARLAEIRLATLEGARPRVVAAAPRLPEVGDSWTYRIVGPGRPAAGRGVYVRIASVSPTLIVEQVSVEGGFTAPRRHARGGYLIPQGVSVFSPYLLHFEKLVPGAELGYIESTDPGCRDQFVCTASGAVAGAETIVAAGQRFAATKVVIEQTWRPAAGVKGDARTLKAMQGGRVLTVWYAAEVKRAVRYESRLIRGERAPLEANFDLELVSYEVR